MIKEFNSSHVIQKLPRLHKPLQIGAYGFCDGAAKDNVCAAGAILFLNSMHWFTFKLNCGLGTNMRAEILALWLLCNMAHEFGIGNLLCFGDSRVTIKWVQGKFNLKVINLNPWCARLIALFKSFSQIIFKHIFREQNSEAVKLSKHALSGREGILVWEKFQDHQMIDDGTHPIFA